MDIFSWVIFAKMSKKMSQNPQKYFSTCFKDYYVRCIFNVPINNFFSSKFFSAPKKDFFEEIDFGHLSYFKNVQIQKVILSFTKKRGIRLDRLFVIFLQCFHPHNVGILVFCRRIVVQKSALQECRGKINDLKTSFIFL